MSGLYNQMAAGQRPESASSASPPSNHPAHFPSFPTTSGGAGMLVVPQPINASKVSLGSNWGVTRRYHLWCLDGSHGRRYWSWLLSSSYQWRSQEIPMQNVSTGRKYLLSSLKCFKSPLKCFKTRERYLDHSVKDRLKSWLGILTLRYFNSN